jgi:peptidoglycan/LPS O-acetylase OafA/YrhL
VKGSGNFSKNNLDLLRLILASIVALYHSSAVTNIPALSPLGEYLSPHFAVRSFFVISGLLIYRSYQHSSSFASYLDKRVRRIYPAYFTVVVLAAVMLCTRSSLPLSQYFGIGFWKYLGANLLFLNFLAPSLPGVFTSNSVTFVDGALWTLKIEVAFYLFVPIMHSLCSRFGTRITIGTLFLLSCLWKYGFALLADISSSSTANISGEPTNIYSRLQVQFPAQLIYFLAGVLLLLYFDELKHHFKSISFITAVVFFVDHWFLNDALDVVWISGFVFAFGFWHYFGNFSKHGDFSYGVYIVHWPILQTLMSFGLGSLNPAVFLFVSLSLVGLAAFLLWNLVESRFLKSSSHYRKVLAPGESVVHG